jgi:hypothetical protein
MPPLSEPFANWNRPAPLMVKAPANVALPLSKNVPPTFASSMDSTALERTAMFPVALIDSPLPESV